MFRNPIIGNHRRLSVAFMVLPTVLPITPIGDRWIAGLFFYFRNPSAAC